MNVKKDKPVLISLEGRKVHPLVYASAQYTYADLGKLLGHSNHSTVAIYTSRAKKKPTMRIPAEWCLALAKLLSVKPASLRPDLYLPGWEVAA